MTSHRTVVFDGRSALVSERVRRALALLTAFAFLLQSLIVQTHIHGAAGTDLVSLMAKASFGFEQTGSGKKHAPAKDDEANCPLCQAAQSAGAFVAAAAIVLILPWQNASFIPRILADALGVSTPSHSWHGRAPPRA